jgi:L-lactate dehydrogenase complex protein LldE
MTEKAQLFITCLSDEFFSGTLKHMVELLERLGVELEFPEDQTCCGQPFYNGGFQDRTRGMARHFLKTFSRSSSDIVSPSGSCVDMVRHKYLDLFPEGTPEHQLAVDVAARTYDVTEYLVDNLHVADVGARFPHKVTYHASCHLLRGLRITEQPRRLLENVLGLELVPLEGAEVCCGFGGVFSVVYPEVSKAMMENKLDSIEASGADTVVACDAGCLMNIGGGLYKRKSRVRAMHLIDVLASGGGREPDR